MKKFLQSKVYELSYYLELVISVILVAAISILSVHLLLNISDVMIVNETEDVMTVFLGKAMTLAVGVEFVKMLCKHSPATVIEVLLFAIARQMVVEHSTALETLIGVLSIAALFATRKYLFIHFDETERTVYRASQKTKLVNILAKVSIPLEDGETLRDVVINRLAQEEKTIAAGECIYYKDFALRIAHMREKEVTRIEVIKSI